MLLTASAKINLWLRVLRRREDGFHEIDTRMLSLDLADTLTLERTGDAPGTVGFTCSDPTLPTDGANLARQALDRLAAHTGAPLPGLRLHLQKAIPHGAGLGGGSSDAAAVLRGANDVCGLGLSIEALGAIAAGLGSDVSFFLHGGAADCRGRGELVTPVPDFSPRLPLLLAKPPFPVPTPWAYQQWRDSREIPGVPYAPQPLPGSAAAAKPPLTLVNDLERPVFAKYLLLAELKTWLLARDEVAAALLSGSGATVFAILREGRLTDALRRDLLAEFGPDTWTWTGRTA